MKRKSPVSIKLCNRLQGFSSLALLVVAALLSVATSRAGPPSLNEISPKAGAVDVPVDTEVVITFNTELDETTLSADSVILEDPDGVPVPSLLDMSDSWEVVITPEQDLAPGTTYRVVLDLNLLRTVGDDRYQVADEALGLEVDQEENTVSYTFTTDLAIRL